MKVDFCWNSCIFYVVRYFLCAFNREYHHETFDTLVPMSFMTSVYDVEVFTGYCNDVDVIILSITIMMRSLPLIIIKKMRNCFD